MAVSARLELALLSTSLMLHAPAPPVGSVDVSTLPSSSTTTHSDIVAHDMAVRP
jgi:hypothetical protein